MSKPSFRLRAGAALCAAIAAVSVQAQQNEQPTERTSRSMIDEVVVTAERRESSLQDTAIAVSAFDQDSLDREQINTVSDMQLSVPNLSFTKGNFTGSNVRIRGIGNDAIATTSDSGTAINFNGAYLQNSTVFESEMYDMERVEVLRGPQGTLYGRNTTGGVINAIPAKADPTAMAGDIELEVGNFQSRKATGMFNLPLGDMAALRVSGRWIERDGFVDNTFADETQGAITPENIHVDGPLNLDSNIDDRDIWSARVALNVMPTDRTEVNFFWQRFREDDSRMRTSNQICAKDASPFPYSLGCEPGQEVDSDGVFESINSQGQLGGILGMAGAGYIGFGTDIFQDYGDPATNPRSDDLREVRTPFTPSYKMDEDLFNLEVVHDFDDYTATFSATYQEIDLHSQTDYAWLVPSFTQTDPNTGNDISTFVPNINFGSGETDANGYMINPNDTTVSGYNVPFTYDTSGYESDTFTTELRIASNWDDKPFDFLAGVFYLESTEDNIYDVRSNTLAALATEGGFNPDGTPIADAADIGLYSDAAPTAFYRSANYDYDLETWAAFGEFYTDISDRTRLTLGLRYSDEQKSTRDRQTLINDGRTIDEDDYIPGVHNRGFLNNTLTALGANPATNNPGVNLLAPLGVAQTQGNRFGGFGVTGNNPVGPFRDFSASWNELTGKVALDHYMDLGFTDETMAFVTLSRSYKSGGINPPSFTGAFEETFEPEYVNAIELGAKNTLLNGNMQLNATYFFYDYEGLQTSKLIDRTAVNENIDATIQGLELETIWTPIENMRLDAFASWLGTEIDSGESIDNADPTGGRQGWTAVKNIDASVYIVPENPGAFDASQCGVDGLQCSGVYATHPDPAFGGQGLETPMVQVPTGFADDVSGNELPGSPEFTVKLGAQYSFFTDNGLEIVPRVDFYWQDKFYSRIYNAKQDEIPSWTQWNASLSMFGDGGNWWATAFVKNIRDKDHITGSYFTDASSGNFTNVFLLEPRTYGVSVGMSF